MTATQCYIWHATLRKVLVVNDAGIGLGENKEEPEVKDDTKEKAEELCTYLKTIAKKWAFQLEKGESGYVHWQMVVNLKVKKRTSELVKMLRDGPMAGAHLSPASNAGGGSDAYAMKEETRVAGPWTSEGLGPKVMPRHLAKIKEWRPWQKDTIDWRNAGWKDDMPVRCIVNPNGRGGKSSLGSWMKWKGLAQKISVGLDWKDMANEIYGRPTSECYIFDVSRNIDDKKWRETWNGIENLLQGDGVVDPRHHFKEKEVPHPMVLVFTNRRGIADDGKTMSKGRIESFLIGWNNELVPWTQEREDLIFELARRKEAHEKKQETIRLAAGGTIYEDPEAIARAMAQYPEEEEEIVVANDAPVAKRRRLFDERD